MDMKMIQLGALSCLIIFSSHGFPIGKWILKKLCISKFQDSMQKDPSPLTLDDLIKKNKDRIKAQLLHPEVTSREPLPFAICNKPALFDLVASSTYYDLIKTALHNPQFDITQLIDETTNNTIFHRCASTGSHGILKLLIQFCKEKNIEYLPLLNHKNNHGMNTVAVATYEGRVNCLSLLLSAGANTTGSSEPLIYLAAGSICRGQTKRNTIIQRLLDNNPDLLWQMSPHTKSVEMVADNNGFKVTADRIRIYKRAGLWHLYNDTQLRLQRLPLEIFDCIINHCVD